MSLNRVILVGNLTRDPELKYSMQGVAIAQMGIAVNRFSKDEQGNYEVDFFNLTAFKRTAEYASKYLTKGSKVAIEGRLQTRSWVDQASGQKRTVFEIIVDNMQNLSSRQDGEMSSAADLGGAVEAAVPTPAPAQRASAPTAAPAAARSGRNAPPPPADDDLDEADPFADE